MNISEFSAKLLTFYIPYNPLRRKIRDKILRKILQRKYIKIQLKLADKVKREGKITVVFYVIIDSVFPAKPLFEKMLSDKIFNPILVIAPDISKGKEFMLQQLNKTYDTYQQKYSQNVLKGYDETNDCYLDFINDADLVCSANPYDSLTHEFFTTRYCIKKDKLSFFINYAYLGRNNFDKKLVNSEPFNCFWRIFIESPVLKTFLQEIMLNQAVNTVVTGYCKMDGLSEAYNFHISHKTRIILAPHHTVRPWKDGLNLSNFIQYADFFLELPKKYPSIEFVFRPHPFLFITLANEELWGKKKVEQYLSTLLMNKNVVYSTEADYFELFANSDALIHDCGSFLAEYLYTDHPQCYLLRDEKITDEEFTAFGKTILAHVYNAYNQKQILNFIDDVVIAKNDSMKQERIKFANEYIKYNYPNASDSILKYLKDTFFNTDKK